MRGAELSERFYVDVVKPLLPPGLRYAAARLGSGSDVLGLDDGMSRDHDWGCRLTLLVDDAGLVAEVKESLERRLPERYGEHPVRFPVTWDRTFTHKVEVATVRDFVVSRLGVDPTGGLSVLDWLVMPGQSVLEVTAGPVFHDAVGLGEVRESLGWYPPDIERYVLAASWSRISERMPMVGRTAGRGDELGSLLLSARLAEDLMWLAFVLCRRWPPYAKWRGTVFKALPVELPLVDVATASSWREREDAVVTSAGALLDLQRERFSAASSATGPFWDRPYRGIDDRVSARLLAEITDPEVARLPAGVGSLEQWVDNMGVLIDPARRSALQDAYRLMTNAVTLS
ncbi:DUF4037 domain-containing protein [Spirillospora sp. NPDC048911]|uniref:DUF4037 domain-containing protein n=1 Tax=Spirillospora sp. NPDC048911 TaxID=3364527 RepID=UPI00371AA20E